MIETAPSPRRPADATRPLRIAMLGMVPGNGHPYSWSAIVNGYDRAAMASCPFPVIPRYLGAQPDGTVCIPDARVTHLWTDRPEDAAPVAAAALIPHVVARPEEVLGQVDAVMIATDDGFEHLRRARPFLEAGLPVFVDKPLALDATDLAAFVHWRQRGARLLSSSGLRYAPEFDAVRAKPDIVGKLRWASGVTCNTWERYGIHLLEPLACVLGPGFVSVRLESAPGPVEVAHLLHRSGVHVTIPVLADGGAAFGQIQLCGTEGHLAVRFADTYTAFRRQMLAFVEYARTGRDPYPFAETVELMSVLIAGLRSRAAGGRRIEISEILSSLPSSTS